MTYTGFPSEILFKDFTKLLISFPKIMRNCKKYVFEKQLFMFGFIGLLMSLCRIFYKSETSVLGLVYSLRVSNRIQFTVITEVEE